jgi:AraC-like DNA-binding protein
MISVQSGTSTLSLIDTLQALLFDLEHGPRPLGEIAAYLGLSERTLRRRLRNQGTSYNKVLRDVRSWAAQECLRDSALTIESIAWRLGYTASTNFRHAFKRWTGQSPQEFRRRLRGLREPKKASVSQDANFVHLRSSLG